MRDAPKRAKIKRKQSGMNFIGIRQGKQQNLVGSSGVRATLFHMKIKIK